MLRSHRAGRERRPQVGGAGSSSLRLVPADSPDEVAPASGELADGTMDAALQTLLRGVRSIVAREGAVGGDGSPERVATLVSHHIRAVLASESPEVAEAVIASALLWAVAEYEGPRLLDGQPLRG